MRNGPPTGRNKEACVRPATPHRETAAKGEKGEKKTADDERSSSCEYHISSQRKKRAIRNGAKKRK